MELRKLTATPVHSDEILADVNYHLERRIAEARRGKLGMGGSHEYGLAQCILAASNGGLTITKVF